MHSQLVEREPLAYACELDRIDAAVLLLESGANEESFHRLPPVWKRDYVRSWLEDREQSLAAGPTCDITCSMLDERVARGLLGVQVYTRHGGRVGVVVGHCLDTTGALLHEVEFEDDAGLAAASRWSESMSYLEVITGHMAYFAEFGSGHASFVPLVAFRQNRGESVVDKVDTLFDASDN